MTPASTACRSALPTGRSVCSWQLALGLLGRERPDVLVLAGTGVALGCFVAARTEQVPALWPETLDLVASPAWPRAYCWLAARVLVQRPHAGRRPAPRAVLEEPC